MKTVFDGKRMTGGKSKKGDFVSKLIVMHVKKFISCINLKGNLFEEQIGNTHQQRENISGLPHDFHSLAAQRAALYTLLHHEVLQGEHTHGSRPVGSKAHPPGSRHSEAKCRVSIHRASASFQSELVSPLKL